MRIKYTRSDNINGVSTYLLRAGYLSLFYKNDFRIHRYTCIV